MNWLKTSLGQKYLMAVSGISLMLFIIMHLTGNLLLLDPSGKLFNLYAAKLHDFGPLFYVGEVALLGLFGFHAAMAILLRVSNKSARPVGYAQWKSKGTSRTRANLSSLYMIVTGSIILAFLVLHIKQFRLGPTIADGYVKEIDGRALLDLYRVVGEVFAQPIWVGFYSLAVLLLGVHLRHGFWSAFQSLGAIKPKWSSGVYALGMLFGTLMAVGFLLLPLYMHFTFKGVAQ